MKVNIKKLGLSQGQINKLLLLKEQEARCEELLKHYDPFWIKKELKEVDDQLAVLSAKKKGIENRRAEGENRRAELNRQLATNNKKQLGIVTQNGLLGKLKKAVKVIEEVESGLVA